MTFFVIVYLMRLYYHQVPLGLWPTLPWRLQRRRRRRIFKRRV